MNEWKRLMISPDASILHGIKVIDDNAMQTALVVEPDGRLAGVVTDGDIRRALLRAVPLDSPVKLIMNATPKTASVAASEEAVLHLMQHHRIQVVPVLDASGRVARVVTLSELLHLDEAPNPVVLMAGGLGSRLGPLTQDSPKPLLEVGGRPILETIIRAFARHGFRKIYISVNYLGEMIERRFGDGGEFGVEIAYLRETMRLGTAGALGLLPTRPEQPFIVMNGDILTSLNFRKLLDFHMQSGATATVAVTEHMMQVPYGVVDVDDNNRMVNLVEKPSSVHFISAGIYVLAPETLDLIPPQTPFDMPSLLRRLMQRKDYPAVYPLHEYWQDVGSPRELEQARQEFRRYFS